MARFFIPGTQSNASAETKDYLLRKRVITLEGQITIESASEIVRQLFVLGSESSDNITMLINSGGGIVRAGLSIIDAMKLVSSEITCVCTGDAYSMAAFIFAQGDKRLMLPHSKLMIHQALIGGYIEGGSKTLAEISKNLNSISDTVTELLAERTGKTMKELKKAMDHDNFMTPEEAISFGIADAVTTKLDDFMEVVL